MDLTLQSGCFVRDGRWTGSRIYPLTEVLYMHEVPNKLVQRKLLGVDHVLRLWSGSFSAKRDQLTYEPGLLGL